jgi:hypothetical protein
LGTTTELLGFHSGEGAKGLRLSTLNVDKTGDALATASTVPELALQAIELNPIPQGHFPQVFAGVALDIEALSQKTDHWHGRARLVEILKLCQLRSVT